MTANSNSYEQPKNNFLKLINKLFNFCENLGHLNSGSSAEYIKERTCNLYQSVITEFGGAMFCHSAPLCRNMLCYELAGSDTKDYCVSARPSAAAVSC